MSFFLPYSPTTVLTNFAEQFSIDLQTITSYESLMLTLFSNLYFFIFWFIIIYFSLKIFNRIWERLF